MPIVATVGGTMAFGRPIVPGAIVTSNLQIWLDANSSTSYPGSGTTWSNLASSGTSYNFTLYNGPASSNVTYNGVLRLSISFDGVNDYASPNTSLKTLADSASWAETREMWVYWRGTAGSLMLENGTASPPNTSWFDAQAGLSNTNLIYSLWQGSVSMTPYTVYNAFTSNSWNHVVWQYQSTTRTLMAYVNGVRTYSNAAIARTTPTDGGNNFYLMLCQGSSTNFGSGSANNLSAALGGFRWYNRILTSNEINTNYNAERGQYGR